MVAVAVACLAVDLVVLSFPVLRGALEEGREEGLEGGWLEDDAELRSCTKGQRGI